MKNQLSLTLLFFAMMGSAIGGAMYMSNKVAPKPATPKICVSPPDRKNISICDLGSIIAVYGENWGQVFPKSLLAMNAPQPAPSAMPAKPVKKGK